MDNPQYRNSRGLENIRNVAGPGRRPRERQKIHVGNAVFEAGRYEGGDRQYESDNLVGDRPARVGQPNRQANEQVAQDASEEQRHGVGLDLCDCRIQYG